MGEGMGMSPRTVALVACPAVSDSRDTAPRAVAVRHDRTLRVPRPRVRNIFLSTAVRRCRHPKNQGFWLTVYVVMAMVDRAGAPAEG
jgi:hypothetical protein